MFYLCTKFDMPSCSDSLVIAVSPIFKETATGLLYRVFTKE